MLLKRHLIFYSFFRNFSIDKQCANCIIVLKRTVLFRTIMSAIMRGEQIMKSTADTLLLMRRDWEGLRRLFRTAEKPIFIVSDRNKDS